ncbi:alpha-1,3-mannosyltransferase ALG2 [Crucibulum laeve]|uniref:Alpha-1,3/1,6-mannosyltransferase ALG2 n=1 Tax=Crucibulum laeve TaxID=68775 RepID=A0A5C3LGT9_9AGAR|nr:alpha-1,3-mannosyltransferase ALG2 [Crucibulum laeve]
MATQTRRLRVAFLHPDLGIGGAERLVVDAALGLQGLGHTVDIYTSHHDSGHCFEETRDGSLRVHHITPPFPRSINGKFHILLAHLRQLHLTAFLLQPGAPKYDVYFVDQLSTCIPFLRTIGHTRVVFYLHFPDKLLSNGAFEEGNVRREQGSLLKRIYRLPMDWLEEATTRQADIILANSKFTARVSKTYLPSIRDLTVVYPGINISAYESEVDHSDHDIISVTSDRPTLLSLNRFEKKKNVGLAIEAFARLQPKIANNPNLQDMRLVIAGGYDPRLEDNTETLTFLINLTHAFSLTYNVITPESLPSQGPLPHKEGATPANPQVLFLLNFTTAQRTALLLNPSTKVLLYTPTNEHFGIGPVEAMGCGVPVLACNTGGPTESIVDHPNAQRTGWLEKPDAYVWADALAEIVSMSPEEREAIARRGKERARSIFGMDAMALRMEEALIEAASMGEVNSAAGTLVIMFFGFLLAYLVGPLVLPSSQ